MEKYSLQDKIKMLLDIEEKQLQKELDVKMFADLRNEALLEFRRNSNKNHLKSKKIKFTPIMAAASLILLATLPLIIYLFLKKSNTDYSDFAIDLQKSQYNTETSLILADGSQIEMESAKSVLTYDNLGEHIEIDSMRTILLDKQEIESVDKKTFNKLVVPYGKQSKITLSDGSIAWLNAGSQLIYPPKFGNKKREVFLSGEAYFEITKNENKPFVVQTSGIRINVLGTAFNVIAYPDDPNVETILVRGSVELNAVGSNFFKQNSFILKPGQLASYSRDSKIVKTQNVDVENYVSWKEGYFLCKKIPLNKLIIKLSRFYNVEIEIDDELTKISTFSGKLENMENIFNILDVIKETTPIQYKESENKIIISSLKGL